MEVPLAPTTAYVIIPPSPLFAAHWSFFIPDASDTKPYPQLSKKGRRIHVTGDRLNGFTLEIIRQYDISKHRAVSGCQYAIGLVDSQCGTADNQQITASNAETAKDEDEGGGYVDNVAMDDFERACLSVDPPGPSLNKVSASGAFSNGKKLKAEVKDCQWWIRQVVKAASENGSMKPLALNEREHESRGPSEIVARLPVH